jgi:SAM-dependent methyltransferase
MWATTLQHRYNTKLPTTRKGRPLEGFCRRIRIRILIITTAALVATAVFFGFTGCGRPAENAGLSRADISVPTNIPRSLATSEPVPANFEQVRDLVRDAKAHGRPTRSVYTNWGTLAAVVGLLEVPPGAVIADIGGGTGVLATTLYDERVDFSRLFVVDVDERALAVAAATLIGAGYGDDRVSYVQSEAGNVRLPADTVDLAVVLSTPFFEADRLDNGGWSVAGPRVDCLLSLSRALKKGGRVDYLYPLAEGDDALRRSTAARVTFEAAGFTLVGDRFVNVGAQKFIHLRATPGK